MGSMFGHFMSFVFDIAWSSHKANRDIKLQEKENKKKEEQKRIKKEKEDSLTLAKITKSLEHLHYEQKDTLRKLTLGNKTLSMSEPNNAALKDNGYIKVLVHVRSFDYLVQINPVITDFITTQWDAEKQSKVTDFIEHDENAGVLLDLLDQTNQDYEPEVNQEVFSRLSQYHGCIRGAFEGSVDNQGYWIWFEDYLLEEFEKQTGKSYIDEVFIPIKFIFTGEKTA